MNLQSCNFPEFHARITHGFFHLKSSSRTRESGVGNNFSNLWQGSQGRPILCKTRNAAATQPLHPGSSCLWARKAARLLGAYNSAPSLETPRPPHHALISQIPIQGCGAMRAVTFTYGLGLMRTCFPFFFSFCSARALQSMQWKWNLCILPNRSAQMLHINYLNCLAWVFVAEIYLNSSKKNLDSTRKTHTNISIFIAWHKSPVNNLKCQMAKNNPLPTGLTGVQEMPKN